MFELKFTVHNVSDRKLEVTVKVNQGRTSPSSLTL